MPELRIPTGAARTTQLAPPAVREASTAVTVSSEAMQARGRGMAAVGSAIAGVGSEIAKTGMFFAEVEKRAQKAEDFTTGLKYESAYENELFRAKEEAEILAAEVNIDRSTMHDHVANRLSAWDTKSGSKILGSATPEAAENLRLKTGIRTQRELADYRKQNLLDRFGKMATEILTKNDELINKADDASLEQAIENLKEGAARGIFESRESLRDRIKKAEKQWAMRRHQLESSNDPAATLEVIKAAKLREDNLPKWAQLMTDEMLDGAERESRDEMSKQSAQGKRDLVSGISKLHNPDKFPDIEHRDAELLWAEATELFSKELITADERENFRRSIFFKPDIHRHKAVDVANFRRRIQDIDAGFPFTDDERQRMVDRFTEDIMRKDVKISDTVRTELIRAYSDKVFQKQFESKDLSFQNTQANRLLGLELDMSMGKGDFNNSELSGRLIRAAGYKLSDKDLQALEVFNLNNEEHVENLHRKYIEIQEVVHEKIKNGTHYKTAIDEALEAFEPSPIEHVSKGISATLEQEKALPLDEVAAREAQRSLVVRQAMNLIPGAAGVLDGTEQSANEVVSKLENAGVKTSDEEKQAISSAFR